MMLIRKLQLHKLVAMHLLKMIRHDKISNRGELKLARFRILEQDIKPLKNANQNSCPQLFHLMTFLKIQDEIMSQNSQLFHLMTSLDPKEIVNFNRSNLKMEVNLK